MILYMIPVRSDRNNKRLINNNASNEPSRRYGHLDKMLETQNSKTTRAQTSGRCSVSL